MCRLRDVFNSIGREQGAGYLENVGKFGVAEVGDDLGRGCGHDSGELESVDGPVQVGGPALPLQRQPLPQRRLVHLLPAPKTPNYTTNSLLGLCTAISVGNNYDISTFE